MIRNARLDLRPGGGSIEIDGATLKGVRSLTLDATAGHLPQLTVDLAVHQIEIDGQVRIITSPKIAATLVALGWTAPPEQPLDSPEQRHAWQHGCGTLNDGTPEDSGCCQGCRLEPDRHEPERYQRFVLVQVGGPNAAA